MANTLSYIYLIKQEENNKYKIGVSTKPKQRLKQLQTANPTKLLIEHTIPVQNSFIVESMLHRLLNVKALEGEWFELTTEDITMIKEKAEQYDNNIQLLRSSNSYVQSSNYF